MGDLSLGGKRTSDGRLVRWCSAGSVVLSWSGGSQLPQWFSAASVVLSCLSGSQLARWRSAGGALVGHDNGDRRTIGAELADAASATPSQPCGLGHAASATRPPPQI